MCKLWPVAQTGHPVIHEDCYSFWSVIYMVLPHVFICKCRTFSTPTCCMCITSAACTVCTQYWITCSRPHFEQSIHICLSQLHHMSWNTHWTLRTMTFIGRRLAHKKIPMIGPSKSSDHITEARKCMAGKGCYGSKQSH